MNAISNKIMEFIYDKTLKRPKKLWNNAFVLYSPERIQLQPGEFKKINMKLSVHLPDQLIAACILFSSFSKNELKLENCQYIHLIG